MYNHNGNTIKSGSAGIDHMRYIRSSQLTSGLQNKSHGQVTFAYDNANNRILKHTSTETRLYILSQVGKPLIEITKDKEGNRSSSFMIYSGAGLCAIYKPQERQTYFPLTDHLHSTRAIWDGTSIVEAFNYLPFGDFMGEVYRKYPARSITHYLFTGQELEPETGLYNFKARFYDPASGRFYSIDPAGEYSSPYLYVGNDPINFYDPTGMFSWEAFGAIMGGIATIAGGILLTVLTAGAATPILVGAAIFGGALIGAGAASLVYGATHTDGSFNVNDWGVMVGLGAAFGAVSGAASFAFAGLSTGAALAAETLLGAGLGSLDGFVTNGVLSEMHDGDFMDGAGEAAGWGALGGGIGGGAGGLLGRGVALGNKRLLNGLNRTHGIRGYIHVRAVGKNNLGFGHSMIGFRRGMYQRGYHQQLVGPVKVNSSKLIRGGRRLLLTKYLRLITRVPQLLPCNCHYSLHKTLRTWPLGG